MKEQILGIDDAIRSIQLVINGGTKSGASGQLYSSDRMQVTGDAIGDIVNLVNKSSLSEYLTKLYESRQELVRERSELNLRLNKIKLKVNYGSGFLRGSEIKLNSLNKQYVELLVRARELNWQNNKTLSQSLGYPRRAGSLIPKHGILIILLSFVAGGFVAAVAALLMPGRQKTTS